MSAEFPDRCLPEYKSIFNKKILSGKYAFVTGGGSGINFVCLICLYSFFYVIILRIFI